MNPESFCKLISEELRLEIPVELNMTFRRLANWSSLNALVIVSRIHEETGVLMTSSDLANMTTFADMYNKIIINQQ
jgi:acyl carrier protein